MILDAPTLEHWDRCRRLGVFLQEWEPVRVTPLGAVYEALRQVLEATDYPGPGMAREYVMQLAGERGVQTEREDPYDMMVHHANLAEVLARAIRQPTSEPLSKHPAVRIPGGMPEFLRSWQPESYLIGGGTRLMRLVLVDHWDDDRQLQELHSWRTIGDISVTGLPMTLRVLVVGSSRSGRRHGPWTRARRHPQTKQLRFARKHAREDGFTQSWETVWREDSVIGPDPWLEQMARDGVLREVAFDKRVLVPDKRQVANVLEDIGRIGDELEAAVKAGTKFPMTRSACDMIGHGPCLFSCCCYAPMVISPGETGVFRAREKKGAGLTKISERP